MTSKLLVEFDKERFSVPGKVPDYGAIFISNSATKEECFRRKLLGLPVAQANFVKQVKAGMILFLFEFERRELHGVFQACSDGAMNIVPHAYRSSGKQFPAQVKFTQIWHCSPLSEKEFCDAIRENYFSANKFYFGLSERQVENLLLLFNSRKLDDKSSQRQFRPSKVARPIRYSMNKGRSAVANGSFLMIDSELWEKDEQNVDGSFGSAISTKYAGDSISSHGRIIDDNRFASEIVENGHKMDSEFGQFTSNRLPGDPMGKVGRFVDDGRFVANKEPFVLTENIHKMDCDFGRFSSHERLGDPFGKVGRLVDDGRFVASKGPFVSTENRLKMDGEFGCFTSHELLGDPLGRVGKLIDDGRFAANKEPFVWAENVHKIDSEFRQFTSNEVPGDPLGKVERLVDDGRIVVSKGPFVVTENGHKMHSEFGKSISNELLGDSVVKVGRLADDGWFVASTGSFVSTNGDCGSFLSNLPAYSSKPGMEANFFINDQFKQASMMCHSVEPANTSLSSSTTSNVSYSTSYGDSAVTRTLPCDPDVPSLNFRHSASLATNAPALPYGPDGPSLNCRSSASLSANVPILKEGNTSSTDYHGHTSMNLDVYQNSERMYSDCQKDRKSVFDRISLIPGLCEQDNDSNVGNDIDSSVNEIMAMLHKSHCQWAKAKNFEQLIKKHDEVANFGNKKQMSLNVKLLKDHLPRISNDMNMADILAGEDNVVQKAEGMPFLDFKRRSNVRKTRDDANTRDHTKSAENAGTSCGQHKRRKLIRPKFSENGSSGDVMVGSHDNESKACQNIELSDVMFHINHVDSNLDAERNSKCEGIWNGGSCEVSSTNAADDRKDASQDVGIQNMRFLVSCVDKSNAEKGLSFKNSEVDGFSQLHSSSTPCNLQESFPELCKEKAETVAAYGGLDHDGGNEKSFQNVEIANRSRPLSSETVIGNMNHNLEPEEVSKKLGIAGGKKQQLFLESVTGKSKASLETICAVSCGDLKKSSQEIYEGNERCEEVLAASAGKGLKMDFEQDTGNGNHTFTSCCEIAEGQLGIISGNQNLTLSPGLVDSGLKDETKEKEI